MEAAARRVQAPRKQRKPGQNRGRKRRKARKKGKSQEAKAEAKRSDVVFSRGGNKARVKKNKLAESRSPDRPDITETGPDQPRPNGTDRPDRPNRTAPTSPDRTDSANLFFPKPLWFWASFSPTPDARGNQYWKMFKTPPPTDDIIVVPLFPP